MDTSKYLTAAQVAELARRSLSQVNRDAASGRLSAEITYPGYRGARLFTLEAVAIAYGIEPAVAA